MPDHPPDPLLARHGLHWVTCTGCTTTVAVTVDRTDGQCPDHAARPTIPTPPPPAAPGHNRTAIAAINPDLTARCLIRWCPNNTIALTTGTPAEIALVYAVHDSTYHRDDTWMVGPAGGGSGDICNPCAGWNGKEKQPLTDGPRHDLCLRDKTEWRGGDCPCTHHKPHMRGIKPGQAVDDERTRAARARLAANRANASTLAALTPTQIVALSPTAADYYQATLIDPEEDTDA